MVLLSILTDRSRRSNPDALDLSKAHFIVPAIVELRRALRIIAPSPATPINIIAQVGNWGPLMEMDFQLLD